MQILGTRCAIRAWAMTDAPSLVRHANALEVARQLRDRFPHPYTRQDANRFLKFTCASAEPTNFAIDVHGDAVGSIGYVRSADVERFSAEIGYWLGETFWGQGIATEALMLLTDHLFASHHLLRLFALPFADNAGSRRVLEKAGYECEGLLRSSSVKYGTPRDQALYARVNTAWRGVER